MYRTEYIMNTITSQIKYVLLFVLLSLNVELTAQTTISENADSTRIPNNWFLLDAESDKILGLSVERAYNTILKNKPARTVIVAVIDSGVDIEHEDL